MSARSSQRRQLGTGGPAVFPLALGCMGMSDFYGPADEAENIATIHAALDAGSHCSIPATTMPPDRTLLIGRALRDRRDKALVSVKFGALRGLDGSWLGVDTRPLAVRNLGYTLTRLGLEHVDSYRPGRLDPNVPIEETIGAIADLQGRYVRAIGLSEVGPETIRLPLLGDLRLGVTAYGVLSRGLLGGSKPASTRDSRAYLPRFSGENRDRNQRLIDALQTLASERGVTASQLAIA